MTDPAGVTTHYEYDILGRTGRISSPGGMEVRYRYDCLDRLEQIHYGNGIKTSYQYDADGNVSHLETRMGSDILLSFRYQYDGNGNRLTKTGVQGPATDGSSALDITCQYDVRGQLLEENRKDAVFRYSYDAAGNRVRKEETGENRNIETVYSYNEKNQLINTEEIRTDGIRRRNTFTYSRQGSILKEETESGTCRYFYNSKNQQIRVERADGQIQENRYDAEGLRHEMRENGKLLRFVYQNGELLYEEGGDKETASYCLGAGIEAVRRGQRTYYYHPDEQLSTALITDETGTIKNQYRYDAFGAGLEVSEELPNRIRYTGQQYDEVTEQYYLRARYYNPILGRFLQEDVCQGDGLNLYAYCRNNPVVYWDPSGYNKVFCSSDKIDDGSGKENTDNKFPERTPEAQAEAQRVVNVGNALKAFGDYDPDSGVPLNEISINTGSPVVAVFLHEDGTVSVGISGAARGNKTNNEYARQLENALNESAGEKKYTVSSIVDGELIDMILENESSKRYPKAGQKVPSIGVCAEPKAASAAHGNDKPIVGFDVRYYDGNGEGNKYILEGANSPNQMAPCDRCKVNEEVYMNYANN